jgi:hypothetical protein
MYMAPVKPRRYRNRVETKPVCEQCLTPEERDTAAGRCGTGCFGCFRVMLPLVPDFRRVTCTSACEMRVRSGGRGTIGGWHWKRRPFSATVTLNFSI